MVTTDIEIGIQVESLADHFLISPNALHRGEDEYVVLTLHERGMLAALLTLHPGRGLQWTTSRTAINNIAPELGRDKISSILKGLREKRYLYTRRVNAGHGRLRWEWRVFMRAQAEGFDPFATTDGPTVADKSVNGPDLRKPSVSAGGTIDGPLGPNQASLKEEVPVLEVQEVPPQPPAPDPTPTTGVTTKPGGEENPDESQAITSAISHQPTWKTTTVRAALRQAIREGLPAPVAYRVIVDLAAGTTYGPTTAGPQRIIARGPWWTPGTVFVPTPPKDPSGECSRHPGQPARACACCAGERMGTEPAKPTIRPATTAPKKARDLLAQIPALRGRVGSRR